MTLKAALLLLLALLGEIFSLQAQDGVAMALKIDEQPDPPRLELQLRLPNPWPVQAIAASAGSQQFPVKFTAFGQGSDDTTALLFLIDKSDPKRARTIEAAKAVIERTIAALDDHTQIAVYAFDSDLVPVAEFGTPRSEVPARLKAVKAVGMATELYRDTIEAIKVLEKTAAGRKAVILFSDGKAEDTTFTLEQTLAAARQANVAICGLGYAEKPSGTIYLQSMRRLAAESCGFFAEADIQTKKEPWTFASDLLARLHSGGRATVDLTGWKTGKQIDFEVRFEGHDPAKTSYTLTQLAPPEPVKSDAVETKVDEVAKKVAAMAKSVDQVPAQVEEAAKKVSDENRKAEEEARAAQAAKEVAAAAAAERQKRETQRRTQMVVGVMLLLVLALVAGWWVRRSRQAASATGPVYARLQVLDGDGTELPMNATAWRIGRGKDNDLTLKNDSVSRHHAEIHRTREGTFTITELNAGNGILVNGEQVAKATLKNDDIIELGEVRIRFLIA